MLIVSFARCYLIVNQRVSNMNNYIKKALGAFLLAASIIGAVGTSMADDNTELKTIMDSHLIRVGAVDAPPWYSKDLKTNQWKGIVPEIMARIFARYDVKVEYVDTQWGTAVAGLQSGRFDLLGAYNETPERAKVIDFTQPIGALRMAVLTFDDPQHYATWSQINSKSVRLGAIDGAGATRLLQPVLPESTWVVNSTSDAMFLELESRRVNAVVTSDVQISLYYKQRGKGTMVLPSPIYSQSTNIGLRKGNDESLKTWLNSQISEMKADGSLDQIWSKYVITKADNKE